MHNKISIINLYNLLSLSSPKIIRSAISKSLNISEGTVKTYLSHLRKEGAIESNNDRCKRIRVEKTRHGIVCAKCRVRKDKSKFNFQNKAKGIYQCYCKSCHNKKMKQSISLEEKRKRSSSEKYKVKRRARQKFRMNNDANYRNKRLNSKKSRYALIHGRTSMDFESVLGCTAQEFRKHIQGKFRTGMTWDNYGSVWQLDHIIPLSHFDLRVKSNINTAYHYTNTQPLFNIENHAKADKLPESHTTTHAD